MEFKLRIKNIIKFGNLIYNNTCQNYGLQDYHLVNSMYKNVSIGKIYYETDISICTLDININNIDMLNWFKVFNDRQNLTIYSTSKTIERYLHRVIIPTYSVNIGIWKKIKYVTFKTKIDELQLLKDWGEADCPIYWDSYSLNNICDEQSIELLESWIDSNN